MKRTLLLIVDPQIDFTTGTLPVEGGSEAMEKLAGYLRENDGRYTAKIITADSHPFDHCSFIENGGTWPRHCIHDTVGAAIVPEVFFAAYETAGRTHVLHKGESSGIEEYSIFGNEEAAERIKAIIRQTEITRIEICGLAGDVCVLSTLSDALRLFPECEFEVLTRFSPSIDGGKKLTDFLERYNVKCDR